MERNRQATKVLKKYMENWIPEMRYRGGEDFNAWQETSRKKLKELLGIDRITPCVDLMEIEYERKNPGFREIRFTFQSEEGYFVPCHLLIPTESRERQPEKRKDQSGKQNSIEQGFNAIEHAAPVMICLQGHSSGMHISLNRPKEEGDEEFLQVKDRAFGLRTIENGFAALVMEQRFMGECGGAGKEAGCAAKGSALPELLMGRTAIGERVWDVQRAIDVLEKYFADRVDTTHIMCMGSSGGGTATYYAACLEKRIGLALASCSVCTYKDSIIPIRHCGCNYVPGIARYFDMGDLGGMIAPRRLVVANGKDDPIFPLKGALECDEIIRKLYQTARAEANYKFVIMPGEHQFFADLSYQAVHELLAE